MFINTFQLHYLPKQSLIVIQISKIIYVIDYLLNFVAVSILVYKIKESFREKNHFIVKSNFQIIHDSEFSFHNCSRNQRSKYKYNNSEGKWIHPTLSSKTRTNYQHFHNEEGLVEGQPPNQINTRATSLTENGLYPNLHRATIPGPRNLSHHCLMNVLHGLDHESFRNRGIG